MAHSGQSAVAAPPIDLETMAALSRVGLGSDTKGPRALRALIGRGPVSGNALIRAFLDAVSMPDPERASFLASAGAEAAAALARARALNLSVVSLFDPDYPPRLAQIVDPPLVLWVRGQTSGLTGPTVALVGSRRATPQGLATARALGRGLAEHGVTVVSGLARGVDGAAHRGALDAGGATVAVLGSGLDVIYPADHEALAREVAANGALLSELPPGTPPYPSHFPLRNRLISGLVSAVVVVEASEKSGSLITARMAAEQGRDVLAVPGGVASGCYRGSHALIKDGAGLVETVEDILGELGWQARLASGADTSANGLSSKGLDASFRPGEALSLDELAARAGRQAPEVLAELGELEVAGKVTRLPGGLFAKT